jgi:hypothetical protein
VSRVRRGAVTATYDRRRASSDGFQWCPESEVAREVGGERGPVFQFTSRSRAGPAGQKDGSQPELAASLL